ncbi:MAG: hypothetical protein K2W96_00770 [Gemmataceae bacterium]|nr:hypothetical protein [Gemmataceae bacterium]
MKSMLRGFPTELIDLLLPGWAARFDLSRVHWLEQEVFLDPPTGERRELDMVGERVLLPSTSALLHIEAESGDSVGDLRRRMPGYHHGFKNKHGVLVLSVAVYLNVGLEGRGMDREAETFSELEIGTTSWPYLGLPALEARDFVAGENILGAALSVKMRIDDNGRARLKAQAMQRVATAALPDQRRWLLMEFIEAYSPLEEPRLAEFHRLMVTREYKEASMLAKTSRELGIEEGAVRGQRLLLRKMAEARFGTLGTEALRRLEAMDEDDLTRLGLAFHDAKSLADLGLADAP